MNEQELYANENENEAIENYAETELVPEEETDLTVINEDDSESGGSVLGKVLIGAAALAGGVVLYKAAPKIKSGCKKIKTWAKNKKAERCIKYAVKNGLADEINIQTATKVAEAEGITVQDPIIDEEIPEK